MNLTNIKLEFRKDAELLILLENNIRGGSFSVMGDSYAESITAKNVLYIIDNIRYSWAIPGDNECEFFENCDLEYPAEKKQLKNSSSPLSSRN